MSDIVKVKKSRWNCSSSKPEISERAQKTLEHVIDLWLVLNVSMKFVKPTIQKKVGTKLSLNQHCWEQNEQTQVRQGGQEERLRPRLVKGKREVCHV